MQGSESMGAKIAHPDYADPQKLFRTSHAFSRSDLCINTPDASDISKDEDLMGHREKLDMSINEKEVLSYGEKVRNEFEKYKQRSLEDIEENEKTASLSNGAKSSPGVANQNTPDILLNSSHSDSYYERLMEKNLNEDSGEIKKYTQRYSSFKSNSNGNVTAIKYKENGIIITENEGKLKIPASTVKRPTKAPPPIPTKPSRLLNANSNNSNLDAVKENISSFTNKFVSSKNEKLVSESTDKDFYTGRRKIFVSKALYEVSHENDLNNETETLTEVQQPINSKGWVKTIVGRFE